MTPAVRPSVTDDARAEAARRWGDRRTSDRLPTDWLDEGMASGFVLGAQWAAARAETTTDLHWSNAAAVEYPGDEYEQYPLRTAFGRGVKWERKRADRIEKETA